MREGALAKVWEYKQKEDAVTVHQNIFDRGMRMMQRQDAANPDYVPGMEPRIYSYPTIRRYADSINDNYPVYGLNP